MLWTLEYSLFTEYCTPDPGTNGAALVSILTLQLEWLELTPVSPVPGALDGAASTLFLK
jgi:hypothetical protein